VDTEQKLAKQELLETVVYKPVSPFVTKIVSTKLLTPEGHSEEVRHIIVDLKGSGLSYTEGQSLGVVPPGNTDKGKPHHVRLYSIASARGGDAGYPETAAICVKRVIEKQSEEEIYLGVASNHLCDLREGDTVHVTGPVGKAFVLPADPSVDLIFVATGTGIAPYRSFIEYICRIHNGWTGDIILAMGARNQKELIYMNEINDDLLRVVHTKQCHFLTARSREETTADGKRMYVQHRLAEQMDSIKSMLRRDNFAVYICGLKGMDHGVEEVFSQAYGDTQTVWEERKTRLKHQGRWNVEVY